MKYLQAREQYENSYDHMVIERCRSVEKNIVGTAEQWVSMEKIKKDFHDKKKGKKKSKPTKQELLDMEYRAGQFFLFFTKVDLAERRPETIQKWIDKDRKRDHLIENALPTKQYCHQCNILMEYHDKDLHFAYGKEKQDYVVLFYGCSRCKQTRWTYVDGREYTPEKNHCEKCYGTKVETDTKLQKNGDTLYTETCRDCGFVKKDVWKKREEPAIDPNYEEDRKRFCMSHYDAFKWKTDMEELTKLVQEIDGQTEEEKAANKKSYKL